MINEHLPDMSGLDVCALLKSYLVQPVIYMVTDKYNQVSERKARTCGVALFECKPIQTELIGHVMNHKTNR